MILGELELRSSPSFPPTDLLILCALLSTNKSTTFHRELLSRS